MLPLNACTQCRYTTNHRQQSSPYRFEQLRWVLQHNGALRVRMGGAKRVVQRGVHQHRVFDNNYSTEAKPRGMETGAALLCTHHNDIPEVLHINSKLASKGLVDCAEAERSVNFTAYL